jgi:N6-L-threonylcarbamoyladenine synthase
VRLSPLSQRPFIAVNHLEGHALTARLTDDVAFPFLLLLISGGHCQLLIVEEVGRYQRLGTTVDDAAGEAFDKAPSCGMGFPAGRRWAAARAATAGGSICPACWARDCDYLLRPEDGAAALGAGFGCRPTSASRTWRSAARCSPPPLIARSHHNAIALACARYPQIDTLVVAGGVAANTAIRESLKTLCAETGLRLTCAAAEVCWQCCHDRLGGRRAIPQGLTDG